MVTMGTKSALLLLQLVVAAALVKMAAAQPMTVTVYNPAGLVVDILVDDTNVRLTTAIVALDITQAEDDLQISVADGIVVDVGVHAGDAIVLIPDPNNPQNVYAFKVLVDGAATLTPPKSSAAAIKPSATPKPPSVSATPKPPSVSATPKPPSVSATPKPPSVSATPKPPSVSATPKPPSVP